MYIISNMFIYNPQHILTKRIPEAEAILKDIPAKYCFISGSFLYKENYADIDVFVISRSEKTLKSKEVKAVKTKKAAKKKSNVKK